MRARTTSQLRAAEQALENVTTKLRRISCAARDLWQIETQAMRRYYEWTASAALLAEPASPVVLYCLVALATYDLQTRVLNIHSILVALLQATTDAASNILRRRGRAPASRGQPSSPW